MIAGLLGWVIAAGVVAFVFGRTTEAGKRQPEPDWLWDQPTDSLSDAAVDARFAEIEAHFRVLS